MYESRSVLVGQGLCKLNTVRLDQPESSTYCLLIFLALRKFALDIKSQQNFICAPINIFLEIF